jgi:hypothetical protein
VELNATLYTRDGGRTWKKSRYDASVNTERLRLAEAGTGTFMGTAAQLLDAEYGWWTVEGDLFRTANGGETWRQLASIRYRGELIEVGQLCFANRELGWAMPVLLGRNRPIPAFETVNGGESWTPMAVPPDSKVEWCGVKPDGSPYFSGGGILYRRVVRR